MINQYISAGTTFNASFYTFTDERLHTSGALVAKLNSLEESVFNTVCTAAGSKIPVEIKPAPAIVKAIDALQEIETGSVNYGYIVGMDGAVTAEYKNLDGEYTLTRISKNGFFASVVDDYGGSRPYVLKMSKRDSSDKELPDGIFYGLLCYLLYSEDGGIPDWASKKYKEEFDAIAKGIDEDDVCNAYGYLQCP